MTLLALTLYNRVSYINLIECYLQIYTHELWNVQYKRDVCFSNLLWMLLINTVTL